MVIVLYSTMLTVINERIKKKVKLSTRKFMVENYKRGVLKGTR